MRSVCVCLSILALSLFSPDAPAQESNPFAEWDSLKSKAAQQGNAKAQSGKVTYFTAGSTKEAEIAAAPAEARRERLKSTATNPAAGTAPEGDAADLAGRVQVAAYSSDPAADEQNATIQQTSEIGVNPFAEFVPDTAGDAAAEPLVQDTASAADDTLADRPVPEASYDRMPAETSGPQAPSVSVEWQHHDELSVGQQCRCDLVVRNTGQSSVRNVLTDVAVPTGLQVVQADPEPNAVSGNAQWKIETLAPGEEQRIRLVVVPQEQGDVQLNAFVRLTAAVSSSRAVTQPLVAIKLEGPEQVEVGQQLAYTVHVTNPGTGTARNVTIQAAVPEGLEHRQGRLLNIDIGTLNPGELRRARLSLTATTGGTHELAVRVVADGDLTESWTQKVAVAEPKLNIGLRGPKVAMTGQSGTYELVVVNEGNVDSNNVRTKYKVPAGFSFESADAGGKYNAADQSIEWFLGTLEPNQVRQLKVTLKAVESGEARHQVGVISEHGRMTMAEHETHVEGFAKLDLQIASASPETAAGEESVFTLRIENAGSSSAANVGLSCELPPGLKLIDIAGPSEYIADSGVVIFRKLPEVAAGDVVEFRIRTRCERPGSHRLRARVASQSIQEPLIGEGSIVGR